MSNLYKVTAVMWIDADSLETAEEIYAGEFTPDSHEIELTTPCPQHEGGYDCTPFCPECEGNQFITATPESWTRDTVVICDSCNAPMLPNVSTLDSDGCAWLCATPNCADYSGDELEIEDLTAVGVPEWVAVWVANLAESLNRA